jgi:rhodanese-related sulfurtransferase
VKVFEATAGTTGLSLSQAKAAGIDAESVVVHKENHTSYFPGSTQVTVLLVYERETGRILGGQTAGAAGADKRLDVLSTAIAAGMTVERLAELDLAYAPPFGTANDPINMAAFVAENRMNGASTALTAGELDSFAETLEGPVVAVDLRDPFSFERAHLRGSHPVALKELLMRTSQVPTDMPVLIISENGKKGHQALRRMVQAGFTAVYNIAGGFTSIARYARAVGFEYFDVQLPAVERKETLSAEEEAARAAGAAAATPTDGGADEAATATDGTAGLGGGEPLIVDVRTPEEFDAGAVQGAVNVPLDDLGGYIEQLGEKDREITVYCASGARSAYALRILQQVGFSNVHNGGGLMDMMARAR